MPVRERPSMTKWKLVPVEPDESQWGGLARKIIMAWDMGSDTPRKLFDYLELACVEIPLWLRAEPEMQNLDHVPSKGTRAAIIYRAMLEEAPQPPKLSKHTKELIGELDAIRGSAKPYPSGAQGQTIGQETWRITLSGNSLQSVTDAADKLIEFEHQCDKLLAALVEVIRISDRDHDAWNHAKAVIAEVRGGQQG